MKTLTTDQKIKKLQKKVSKINSKIEELTFEQKQEEKKKAFDLILELGEKHSLFTEMERVFEYGFAHQREELRITMINPIQIIKREV